MSPYFKNARPDGTDWPTGELDFSAALASGEILRSRTELIWITSEPGDDTHEQRAFTWPCRLFVVEPIGSTERATLPISNSPYVRLASALRVIEERPAVELLGPQGPELVELFAQAASLTTSQRQQLRSAWVESPLCESPVYDWATVSNAAYDGRRQAFETAGQVAAGSCNPTNEDDDAEEAVFHAALALVVRDRIAEELFDLWFGPWSSVISES